MTTRKLPARKFDGVPTLPLFADDAVPVMRAERQRTQRAVTFARCPLCTAERIGLVRSATHLLWRTHDVVTWSGARLPCHGSGVALCALPGRDVPGVPTPTCSCIT